MDKTRYLCIIQWLVTSLWLKLFKILVNLWALIGELIAVGRITGELNEVLGPGVINNKEVFNILLQIKSIKDCGCLDPSLQNQCFERFK